jgi:TRAP-type C4-dicarboxylate transport system substrate-binding protein
MLSKPGCVFHRLWENGPPRVPAGSRKARRKGVVIANINRRTLSHTFAKEGRPMKEKLALILSMSFLFVLGLTAPLTAPSAIAASIELRYSTFFPPTHIQAKLAEEWIKEVEEKTNGKVKITFFPGGTLGKGPEIYSHVLKGITDIGFCLFAYTRGRFPVMETVDLPLGYPSGSCATQVINQFFRKFKPRELDDVQLLYLHAHGPGLLHSKAPASTMADLKGMKIRSTGFSAKVAKALGGVPVAMGQGGAYEALQKGVVEATLSPMEVLKGWKQAEVIKSTTECFSVGYTTGFYVVINKRKWQALPRDVRKVMRGVSKNWIPKHGEAWDQSDREGREYTLSLGNEIISLSAEESARWRAAVRPVIDDFILEKEKQGMPAKKYVSFLEKEIEKCP